MLKWNLGRYLLAPKQQWGFLYGCSWLPEMTAYILSACFRPTALIRRFFKCGKFARTKTKCKKFGGSICPPAVRQSLTDIIMMVYLAMAFFPRFVKHTDRKQKNRFSFKTSRKSLPRSYRPPKLSQVWYSHVFRKGAQKKATHVHFPAFGR